MLVVVLLAFRRAGIADAGADLEHFLQHRFVAAGTANGEPAGRFANIRAVETRANALEHVHFLGRACIGAAETHSRAIHQVMSCIGERLVDMTLNVWVQPNHFPDGHSVLLLSTTEPVDGSAGSA